jgi:hypothetical protein
MKHEIHLRWPYEVWVCNPNPNPNREYTLLTRKVTEYDAIKNAKSVQNKQRRKTLVFFHPSPDSERVMVWNDTSFLSEDIDGDGKSKGIKMSDTD